MDKKSDKKIDADELLLMMKELGWAVPVLRAPLSLSECARPARHRHKCSKADAEEMIWEVDEDCDRYAARGPRTRTQRAPPPVLTIAAAAAATQLPPPSVAPCLVQVRELGGVQGHVLPRETGQVRVGAPPTVHSG